MLGVNCFCQHYVCQENMSGTYDNGTALNIVVSKKKCMDQIAVLHLLEKRENKKNNQKNFNACMI